MRFNYIKLLIFLILLFSAYACSPSLLRDLIETSQLTSNTTGSATNLNQINLAQFTRVNIPGASVSDSISSMAEYGGHVYFSALNGESGQKLYRYNGVTTTQISDINPGGTDDVSSLYVANGILYFTAKNTSGRTKLFGYDGSTITQISNTALSGHDSPGAFVVIGNDLYFQSRNPSNFIKGYKVNGTTVTQITDINAGANDDPSGFVAVGTDIFFTAKSGVNTKLFKYNGTTTTQISNTMPGGDDAAANPSPRGTSLCFKAETATGAKLFEYDGVNVTQVSNTNPGGSDFVLDVKSIGNNCYFIGVDTNFYFKVYKYDGALVTQVSDTNPGLSDGVTSLTVAGVNLYFSSYEGTTYFGNKLFMYNGTTVSQASDTNWFTADDPTTIVAAGNNVYFLSKDAMSGGLYKVYFSDGTGSIMLPEANPGLAENPNLFFGSGSLVYFASTDSNDRTQAYIANKDTFVLTQISDTNHNSDILPDDFDNIYKMGSKYYFTATKPSNGEKRFLSYDGTTVVVEYDFNGFGDEEAYVRGVFNGKVLVNAYDGTQWNLYAYDGTTATVIEANIILYTEPTLANDTQLFFSAYYFGVGHYKLFSYDGNVTVTQITDINPGDTDFPRYFKLVGNTLYFMAFEAWVPFIYKYDGVSVTKLPDIGLNATNTTVFASIGTDIYLSASPDGVFNKLFKFDGVTATQISNTNPGGHDSPVSLRAVGTSLYFKSYSPLGFQELYKYDGTNVTQVSNTNPTGDDGPAEGSVIMNGVLYGGYLFTGSPFWWSTALYAYDGTNHFAVGDHSTAFFGQNPDKLRVLGSNIYYSALNDSGIGYKIFKSDGATITQISNTNPGGSDNPQKMVVVGDRLFFEMSNGGGQYFYTYKPQ